MRCRPGCLQAYDAQIRAVGFFGSIEDFLDGAYQYPGGWLGDHFGRRNTLLMVGVAAALGYATYLLAPSWPWLVVGLIFVAAWSSMGSPTLLARVGDSLPKQRRAMGFTVQSILKRIP